MFHLVSSFPIEILIIQTDALSGGYTKNVRIAEHAESLSLWTA